jgi:hypothetical protein
MGDESSSLFQDRLLAAAKMQHERLLAASLRGQVDWGARANCVALIEQHTVALRFLARLRILFNSFTRRAGARTFDRRLNLMSIGHELSWPYSPILGTHPMTGD